MVLLRFLHASSVPKWATGDIMQLYMYYKLRETSMFVRFCTRRAFGVLVHNQNKCRPTSALHVSIACSRPRVDMFLFFSCSSAVRVTFGCAPGFNTPFCDIACDVTQNGCGQGYFTCDNGQRVCEQGWGPLGVCNEHDGQTCPFGEYKVT